MKSNKVNLTKAMILIGYSERVAKSMKSRYLSLALPSVDKDEIVKMENVTKEVAMVVMILIAEKKGKCRIKAKELRQLMLIDFDFYLAKEKEVKYKTNEEKNSIATENIKLKNEIKKLKERRDTLRILLS